MTPHKRLVYIGGVASWVIFTVVSWYVTSEVIVLMFLALCGVAVAVFYGFKYFLAYKYWLDSYTELRLRIGFKAFVEALRWEHLIKKQVMPSFMKMRWLRYARPRQERWNRNIDDIGVSKINSSNREEFVQEHSPSIYSFSEGVVSDTGLQIDPINASHLIGRTGSQVIRSLYRPMASTPH